LNEVFGRIKKGSRLIDPLFHDQFITFDDRGNALELIEYRADGTILTSFTAISCNESNNYESVYIRYGHEPVIDKKQFMIESVNYNSGSGEFCFITYVKDQHGQPIEEIISNLMGRVLYTIKINRDEKGNPTKYRFSDGSVHLNKFDSKGNKIESILNTYGGNTIQTYYKYDFMGNVIIEEVDNFYISTYKYHIEYNTFKYQYDSIGNWTERIDYEHGIPQRMVVRTIEYSALLSIIQ
jgi:hypothetical protein